MKPLTRGVGAWGVGALALAATWGVAGFIPTEDDIQAPFVAEARVGGDAVSLGLLSARVSEVKRSEKLEQAAGSARSHWVMVSVEATATDVEDRALPAAIRSATLQLGERNYSASARADNGALGFPLVAQTPVRLDFVFEIAAGDSAAEGVLVLSPRLGDDRLATVLDAPIDLATATHVSLLTPATPDWVKP